ncbi:hypothetical protein B296_00026971 [Ensete ventricosum]|uniref:Uncharacterized protein n=1 Tax=Ensete ventricosum TaxID=4639 RepID=A0A427A4H0_ENSVE|nr:hypothetical protein B296_00026971 [Ensete ventricosum]
MKSGAPAKVLPIEIPAIPLAELNRLTSNFGQKALVGEGSYGQVYRATLSTGEPVAIKKLDPSASNDPDSDFAAQATPRLSEDKVKQCVDPKLENDFPPKAVAKLAAVAALCVQYEADFRPNMTIVVKALQPLLHTKPGQDSHQ